MSNTAKKILLLDLGGVVASLGDPVEEIGLNISSEEFWAFWLSSDLVRKVETGVLSPQDFLQAVASPLGEQPSPEFAARFSRWRIAPFAGVIAMLPTWAREFRLALLSNTNPIHWRGARSEADFSTAFDKLFLSFETSHFKPAPAAFQQVVDYYQCAPGEIHFLDDSEKNVDAATQCGLNAYHVAGASEVLTTVAEISRQ